MEKSLGKERGIWVSKSSNELKLHLPVESGYATYEFDYPCTVDDLRVLERNRFRRKMLEFILHVHLQPTTIPGHSKIETTQILRIIQSVLHGTMEAIEQEIQMSPDPFYVRWLVIKEGIQLDT